MDQWLQEATLPGAELGGSTIVASPIGSAYLFGGYNFFNNSLRDIWRYDIPSNHWDSIGQMPGFSRSFAIFWEFDSLIIGGAGEVMDTNLNVYAGNDYYCYNTVENHWRSVAFQNSFDSSAAGASFIYGKKGYYFGGLNSMNPNIVCSNNMRSFDASKYIHDTTTGIVEVANGAIFKVYPNPVNNNAAFSISTSDSGDAIFYDALGRVLDERKLVRGINQIKLSTNNEVVFYRATLQYGAIENGKVVFVR